MNWQNCWKRKILFLDKLPGNGVPHSYWSKRVTCFDNVVDRWHYRQYFSFPPRKTVKNLVSLSVGGSPTLGTRTIHMMGHSSPGFTSACSTQIVAARKVMFSEAFVCPQGGLYAGGLCAGGSLSRAESLSSGSLSRGLCPEEGVSVWWVSVMEIPCHNGRVGGTHPTGMHSCFD